LGRTRNICSPGLPEGQNLGIDLQIGRVTSLTKRRRPIVWLEAPLGNESVEIRIHLFR